MQVILADSEGLSVQTEITQQTKMISGAERGVQLGAMLQRGT